MAHFFAEKLYDGGTFVFELSLGEDFGFDWFGAGDGVKTDESFVVSEVRVMTEYEQFFIEAVRQRLWRL